MTLGLRYQLVEILAPAGYQIPFGQWRITTDGTDFTITVIGDSSTPIFVDYYLDGDEARFLGNWPDFDLPLTGGLGAGGQAAVFTAAGIGIIGAGVAIALGIKAGRKTQSLERTRVKRPDLL